mmetsp:Transcript_118031/g.205505  ORF Transcript_118031/g.205505 Transcript_118031/m.205505 type:complete len:200 (+) Transcript_118031:1080-1679(+)
MVLVVLIIPADTLIPDDGLLQPWDVGVHQYGKGDVTNYLANYLIDDFFALCKPTPNVGDYSQGHCHPSSREKFVAVHRLLVDLECQWEGKGPNEGVLCGTNQYKVPWIKTSASGKILKICWLIAQASPIDAPVNSPAEGAGSQGVQDRAADVTAATVLSATNGPHVVSHTDGTTTVPLRIAGAVICELRALRDTIKDAP